MFKVPNQAYTTEFNSAAVQQANDGQSIRTVVARVLKASARALCNGVGADQTGKLNGVVAKVVTCDEMEGASAALSYL